MLTALKTSYLEPLNSKVFPCLQDAEAVLSTRLSRLKIDDLIKRIGIKILSEGHENEKNIPRAFGCF